MSTGDRRAAVRAVVRGPADALLLAWVTAVAAAVPALMRLPLPVSSALIQPRRFRSGKTRRPPSSAVVERLVAHVDAARVAGYPLVRQGCLTRAVTLYWFLSRAGLAVELRFGIATHGAPDGHCWLSLEGRPFLERADPEPAFTVTFRVPAACA